MLDNLFGINLHTAGKVIGWVGSIVSFLGIICLSVAVGHDFAISELTVQDYDYISSVSLAFAVLFFLSSIMLIVGTVKNRHFLLLPWLLTSGFAIVTIYRMGLDVYVKLLFRETLLVKMLYIGLIGLLIVLNMYVYYGICSLVVHIRCMRDQECSKIVHNEEDNRNETRLPYYIKI